jgi:hypothetical protein
MSGGSGPDSATITLPLFPSPGASPREQGLLSSREPIVVVGPFFPDDAFIVEIVENLSSRFLMGLEKNAKFPSKMAFQSQNSSRQLIWLATLFGFCVRHRLIVSLTSKPAAFLARMSRSRFL